MNLEQISLRVWQEASEATNHTFNHEATVTEFARRLVAALGAQEPVGRVVGQQTEWGGLGFHAIFNVGGAFRLHDGMDIFATPPICPTVPDGWQLVPKELSREMCEAAHFGPNCAEEKLRSSDREFWEACYSAMLAAAPEYKP